MNKSFFDRMSPAQILALGFFGLIVVGAMLLAMPFASTAEPLSIVDAFFTATSAVCVTGLVVVDTGSRLSVAGQGIVLFLIQFGGLGIMTMATTVALFIGKKITFRERLVMQEALNHFSLEGLVRLVKYVLAVTLLVESVAAVVIFLRLRQMFPPLKAAWFAVFHSVSAFCNAGFDLFGNSLESFVSDPLMNIVFMSLIVLGGIGFSVIADVYTHRGFRKLSTHSRLVLRVTVLLIVLPAIIIGLMEWNGALAPYDTTGKIFGSLFTSVTTRTAGFNTVPTANLGLAVLTMAVILMFIGASPASTGGGIKTTTFALILMFVVSVMKGENEVTFADRRIPQRVINKSIAIAFVAVSVVATATFLLSALEQQPFSAILFEAVSAFGTVGLSRGITSSLSTVSKIVVIITMFTGRVGVLTFALALSARRATPPSTVRYPEGQIIVG
jgi:trk system potassium uptake protein